MFERIEFWSLLVVFLALLHLTPVERAERRAGIIAAGGIVALAFVFDMSLAAIVSLVIAVGALYGAMQWLTRRNERMRIGTILMILAPFLAVWAVGKAGYAFDNARLKPLLLVGFSYLLVKIWSLLKDIIDGKVTSLSPAIVAAYLLYTPTFLSGPMHYYSEFEATIRNPAPVSGQDLLDATFRFTLGFVKVHILAALLAPASLLGLPADGPLPVGDVLIGAVIYSFVLYFDFSGYVDMVIATSRLIGIRVPENFNWPYLAHNIGEFWRRWHITFSRALTAHVFMPVVKACGRIGIKQPAQVSFIGYVATFLFGGYWHGATSNFVLWGLYHAIGLFVQDRWTKARRKPGPPVKVSPYAPARLAGIAVTAAFVTIGWIVFVLPVASLGRIVLP